MKTIIAILLLATSTVQAQLTVETLPDTAVILRVTDDMTNESYVFSTDIKAFELNRSFDMHVSFSNAIVPTSIVVHRIKNIGTCVDKATLVLLFEDGSNMELVMYNDFNCKGYAFFRPTKKQWENLAKKRVTKIRFREGGSYQSCDYIMPETSFFISLLNQAKNKQVQEFKY